MAVPAAGWVVLVHPEITPSSNFYQTRDTTPNENSVDNIAVLFAAENAVKQFVIVGYYLSSAVFREPVNRPDRPNQKIGSIIRFKARNAKLIAPENRYFRIPRGRNGMGQSNLWYGLTQEQNPELYKDVLGPVDIQDSPLG